MKLAAIVAALIVAASAGAGRAAGDGPWNGVPILMYHRVDPVVPTDAVGRSLTLDPARFAASLSYLRAHHIRTLTTAQAVDALARGQRPQHSVVLSFDDGYEDAATVVTPLLRKYGARASFYVSADLIGTPRHATWRELRMMRDAGMEIACHGSRHLDLTLLSAAEKRYEVGHCAAALHHWLGTAPRTYAYAAGRYDAATIALMPQFGFRAALTEHPGVTTSLRTPYELPRRRIDRDTSTASFAALVDADSPG